MKAFNLVSAVVAATVLAGAVFQAFLTATDSPSGRALGAGWVVAAVAWALVFGLVRDGLKPTLSVFRR